MTLWQPPTRKEGYLPIEDHGLIGDGRGSSALVGRDTEISFMCVPRFDADPVFCSLLDRRHGGTFRLSPADVRESRQRYVDDTAVLVTELRTDSGAVEVTDAFLLRPGARLEEDAPAAAGELVRRARVTRGEVTLRLHLEPRGGAHVRRSGDAWLLDCRRQDLTLHLRSSPPLAPADPEVTLQAGQELVVRLRWDPSPSPYDSADDGLQATLRAWRRWAGFVVEGVPRPDLVRRSALTLKLLDHVENGAIIAAPTSSLPEHIGGTRNWDYRYSWIRDAAYTVFALRRIGLPQEAGGFLDWALAAARHNHQPRVLYDIDGNVPAPESVDEELEGHRRSAPVRWGTRPSSRPSTTCTGRSSTAPSSGRRPVAPSTRGCGSGWRGSPSGPDTPGVPPITASGRSARPVGPSPTRRPCARWPSTGPPGSRADWTCRATPTPGHGRPSS